MGECEACDGRIEDIQDVVEIARHSADTWYRRSSLHAPSRLLGRCTRKTQHGFNQNDQLKSTYRAKGDRHHLCIYMNTNLTRGSLCIGNRQVGKVQKVTNRSFAALVCFENVAEARRFGQSEWGTSLPAGHFCLAHTGRKSWRMARIATIWQSTS